MNSRTTRRFRDLLSALPSRAQRQARAAYKLFQRDPAHPSLRFKLVHSTPPIYSARVGIGYRALGTLNGDKVAWFWIGSHAEYDRILAQL